MQALVDWALRIFETQVIKKKRPVRPVFPDYLFISYDYEKDISQVLFKRFIQERDVAIRKCSFT